MSTAQQGSQQWETCRAPPPPSSQSAALPSPEISTAVVDTGTIPILPANQSPEERRDRVDREGKKDKGTRAVDSVPRQFTPLVDPSEQIKASLPLPIASPWQTPVRPESPGVAPSLLRRAARASAPPVVGNAAPARASRRKSTPDHHHPQSLAAVLNAHHAVPAPPEIPPHMVLDCTAAQMLQASVVKPTKPSKGLPREDGENAGEATPSAATPDLRSALASGFVRRRSGSGNRKAKPARARSNTKVCPHHVGPSMPVYKYPRFVVGY